jgi:hypothetical protein
MGGGYCHTTRCKVTETIAAIREQMKSLTEDLEVNLLLKKEYEVKMGIAPADTGHQPFTTALLGTFERSFRDPVLKANGQINVKYTAQKHNLVYHQFLYWVKQNHPEAVSHRSSRM